MGPARDEFADNYWAASLLGYREDILGRKVYFSAANTVIYRGQITLIRTVMYNDRRGPNLRTTFTIVQSTDIVAWPGRSGEITTCRPEDDEIILS